jgi:ribosomal protein S10
MKSYSLTFLSKNKNSLNNFFLFFNKTPVLYFNIFKKYFNKKKKIKKFTILKSPHVNKTAQEQFEIRIFSRQLNIYSSKNLKYLIDFKKIKNNLLSAIFVKINFFLSKKNENNLKLNIISPNNFKIQTNFYKNQKINRKSSIKKQNNLYFEKIKNFIKVFDVYGELKIFV